MNMHVLAMRMALRTEPLVKPQGKSLLFCGLYLTKRNLIGAVATRLDTII